MGVIQSMLSYIPHQKSTKCVSKAFKKSTKKNEICNKRIREQMIASEFKGENVWNLYQNGDNLSLQKNEDAKEYIASLDKAFDEMQCGDKIYIHDGKYELQSCGIHSKNIQIEGIGKCEIKSVDADHWGVGVKKKVSIKNVTLEFCELPVMDGGSLWLTDCTFSVWLSID